MYAVSGYMNNRCDGPYRVATGMIHAPAGDCRTIGGLTVGNPQDWEWVLCIVQFCRLVAGKTHIFLARLTKYLLVNGLDPNYLSLANI